MRTGVKTAMARVAAGSLTAAVALLLCAPPAGAQGLFERIFGGFRREAPQSQAYADPFSVLFGALQPQRRADNGPASAFCVRGCDGHYFPVRAQPGFTAAQACRAFCPASETRIYSGGNIDYAVANDGSRYADLPNAYAYRKQIVAGCSCNGRDAFGLAQIDPASDPTLKPGDVVATKNGLMAVSNGKNQSATFAPAQDYRGFSKGYRDQLSATKIMPPNPGASAPTVSSIAQASATGRVDKRRAQNDR
jgi:hypothetical protein